MGLWGDYFSSLRPPEPPPMEPMSMGFGSYFDNLNRLQEERRARLAELQATPEPEGPTSFFGALGRSIADTGEDITKAAFRGVGGMASGLLRAGQATGETLARLPVPESWKQRYLANAERLAQEAAAGEEEMRTGSLADRPDAPKSIARDIGLGAFEMLPQLGVVAATGGIAGPAVLGTSSFGHEYAGAKEKGATDNQALISAAVTGLSEAALERLVGDVPLLRRIAGEAGGAVRSTKEALASLLKSGNQEGMEEAGAFLASRLGQEATYSDEGWSLGDVAQAGKQYGSGFGMAMVPGLAGSRAQMNRAAAAEAALPTSTEFGTVEIGEPELPQVPRETVVRDADTPLAQRPQEALESVIPPPTTPAAVQEATGDAEARLEPREPIPVAQAGKQTSVVAPGFDDVRVRYAVVELESLLPSHTDSLQENPAYPQEIQPRDRDRAGLKEQVNRIARKLDPRQLGENIHASDGAPIIGPDGIVESGNGRVLALRLAYQQNPERIADYRAWLEENASGFGISPETARGLAAPVLVRVRETDVDRPSFARAANQGSVERLGSVEQAKADARALPDRVLELLVAGEQGDLNTAGNVPFLREFFGAVTPEGLNAVTTKEGQVSNEGIRRAQAAVLTRAYSAPGLVEAMFEDPDSNVRRAGNGLLIAAPRYSRMRNRMEAGNLHPLDIASDLEQAINRLQRIRAEGQTVDEYLEQQRRQGAMFEVRDPLTPEAAELLRIFGTGDVSKAARRVNLFTQRYMDLVEGAGNPTQGALFGDVATPPSKLELILRAEREWERGGVQEDLFAPAPGAIELATEGYVRNLQGPLGWLFGNRWAPLKAPRSDDVRSSIDEVEERWRNARGIKTVGMVERMVEGVKNAVRKAPRTWLDLDPNKSPQHARTADALRRVTAAESAASSKAFDEIDYITRDLSPIEGELFTRMLVLPDIAKDAEAGLYEGKELPFGYPNAAAVESDLARFAAQATPAVQEALQRRQEIAETVAHRLVDAKLLPEEILTDSRYYHRQVMAYMDGKGRLHEGRRGVRTTRRGFQRERVGGSDFNTRYAEAEFEWLADAYELLAKHQVLQEMRADLDIKPRLMEQAKTEGGKWQDQIPEGYAVWQPQPSNRFYRALTVTESELEKFFEKLKQQATGEELAELKTHEALALGGPKEQWVIPEDIAATLDRVGKPDAGSQVGRPFRFALSLWKQWRLLNPESALKYNVNNMSGDLDIAITADPKILKHLPKAFRMVWAYHISRNPTPALRKRMNDLEALGVTSSGWSLQEVEDLGKDGMLRAFTERRPGPLSRLVQRYWTNVRAFTTARENLLRIAAYERAQELQAQGKEPAWASTRDQVRAIKDPNERAAKLSRDLVGDYGNISEAGRWLRANMMPFYSWMEINAPRYVRLFKNAPQEGRSRTGVVGAKVAGTAARVGLKTASLALRPVGLTARAAFLYGLVQLWNRMMFPEEDEELRKSRTRREPHLILGRTEDGEIRSIRFEGALGDALEWFSLHDVEADVRDLRTGRKTPADMAAEAVKAPIERVAQSIRPDIATAIEVVGGRSTYPRIFEEGTSFRLSPRPVYDKAGTMAERVALGIPYELATGKPQRRGSIRREFEEGGLAEGLRHLPAGIARETLTYTTDPGEAAYWDTKSMVRDWLREQDKQQPTGFEKSKRGMALYYWKKAKQYGDERAEKKYRDLYLELGGTQRGMMQSIRMSGPLGGISKDDQGAFLRSLSPDERERLMDAQRWYMGVFR